MRERMELLLKGACGLLAVLMVVQAVSMSRRLDPLRRTSIPEVPTWKPAEPSPAAGAAGPGQAPGAGAVAGPAKGRPPGGPPRGGMGPGGPGGPGPALPPEAQARVDRIVKSEVLGMIMRPPPMALLGIVGSDVLLRTATGMSGLVREGGELGGVQVLRIGTNRVLVRENGEEKELTIFDGMGGESLLPKPKEGTP